MRFERQHGGNQTQILGPLDQAGEHGLMATMDTVEIADCQRQRGVARLRHAAKDAHSEPLLNQNIEF